MCARPSFQLRNVDILSVLEGVPQSSEVVRDDSSPATAPSPEVVEANLKFVHEDGIVVGRDQPHQDLNKKTTKLRAAIPGPMGALSPWGNVKAAEVLFRIEAL